MLIEFNVSNFLSFKEEISFSLAAHSIKERRDTNVFKVGRDLELLKSAAIYGPNAGGKTNLAKAFIFFKNFILNSAKESTAAENIPVENFRLSSVTESKPSKMEAFFVIDKVIHQYGFSVTKKEIKKEWLYSFPNNQKRKLFERSSGNKIEVQHKYYKEGKKSLIPITRNNSLFLSVVAQWNGEIAKAIQGWLLDFNIINGYGEDLIGLAMRFMTNRSYIEKITDFLKHADVGINDFLVKNEKLTLDQLPPELPDEFKKIAIENGVNQLFTVHNKYDSAGKIDGTEIFNLAQNESHGTQKMFAYAGPILQTLERGMKLFIDEIDASLHPELVEFLVKLFNSKEANPKNAQLIFTTHQTSLLDKANLRRDQVWFIEKDNVQSSKLYPLLEFKPRNDFSLERNYLKGRFGARPHIGDYHLNK